MCCTRLAANAGPKKVAKNRHLGTIAQHCPAISLQLRHLSTIGKKLVKQKYLHYMSPQYCELRPTSGWDRLVSLGYPSTPANFNGFRVLAALLHGTLVVGVGQTAALNRGRHLYSAGRPSRWALAHISSLCSFCVHYNQLYSLQGLMVYIFTPHHSTTYVDAAYCYSQE